MDRSRIATDTDGLFLGDLKPGARVGDYAIEATISARGTGVVYRATHLVLPRRVTVKIMPAVHEWSRRLAMQLLREACIVEAFDHPGIARVYECGVLADRRPWVATELVEGPTLADTLERTKMSPIEIAGLIHNVAEILEHAHWRGVVHCNLTPQSIVIPNRNNPRFPVSIGDWASARTFDSTTPAPMLPQGPARPHHSPEQRIGGVIDGRTDIYALGVIAFRALYGVLPEPGTHPPLQEIPPMLAALVAQMLAKDPDKRPNAAAIASSAAFITSMLEDENPGVRCVRADTDVDAMIDNVIDAITDEPSSGVPVFVADLQTVPSGRVITSEQVAVISGEIEST
jgi:eukaryotic-like serine/threonine-protein kinase